MDKQSISVIAALLLPIEGSQPAGCNMEYQPLYEQIRQARESDPDYLPQDEWASTPRKADWLMVARLSETVLKSHSKDMQVACWLTEAWSQINGIEGLLDGLKLLNGMMTDWWEQCWPALEDEGASYRHGQLNRLDRDLSQLLLTSPLLQDAESSLMHWQQVLSYQHQAQSKQADASGSDFSMAAFMAWASKLPLHKVTTLCEQLSACQQSIDALEQRYSQQNSEAEGYVLRQTQERIGDLQDFVLRIAKCTTESQEETLMLNVLEPQAVNNNNNETVSARRDSTQQQVMSRELAISQMLTISHYFRQTEPSSPVPMLMERAARWATMPLSEWLQEMVGDERSLQEINFVLHGPTPK